MTSFDCAPYIEKALRTEGGHLSIGRGGYSIHYGLGRLSGYDCDEVKKAAIAAGLPVIDSRNVAFEKVAKLAISGPMVATGRPADPSPWHSMSFAPLLEVAGAYAAAGAEVYNLDVPGARPTPASLRA
jgi:hypothetical protein